MYRGSPLSTNSLSTIPEVVRFINSTKSVNSLKKYDLDFEKKNFFAESQCTTMLALQPAAKSCTFKLKNKTRKLMHAETRSRNSK